MISFLPLVADFSSTSNLFSFNLVLFQSTLGDENISFKVVEVGNNSFESS